MLKVERIDNATDEYPLAAHTAVGERGELHVQASNGAILAIYAAGEWLRGYSAPNPKAESQA